MRKPAGDNLLFIGLLVILCYVAPSVVSAESPTAPLEPRWAASLEPEVDLEAGWKNPPAMARPRCWWWWLNGNVTKEAITRDLEEMKAKGLGGANIIDAGGADQRGNRQVPHGPDFGSPEWREQFLHALKEADRLGLELGLNIQSGWNLGGPVVGPEHAAKKIVFAETSASGGRPINVALPQPPVIGDYYRDVAILAVPVASNEAPNGGFQVTAENSQSDHPPGFAVDGDSNTFWVSNTKNPGDGPSLERPVRLEFEFSEPATVSQIVIHPREDYGPKRGWVQAAAGPKNWHILGRWNADATGKTVINFPATRASRFRLVIVDAHDPRSPVMPRNVQVAEIELRNNGDLLQGGAANLARIENFAQKAYHQYPGPFTATKADHLLGGIGGQSDERVIDPTTIIDVTEFIDADGRLTWEPPAGSWKILRFGYTLTGSRVSTSSQGWNGWAINYLDPAAFDAYWKVVVEPLLEIAKPYIGRSLHYLHTDSWELGPVNWTPALPQQFADRRGYDPTPFLPALAGYVVGDRATSNRFLNDFRRTLADLIAAGKYATFREYAHKSGLGIHPESGGPHAAPIDALLCLGRNDIPMGEFWARSPTHRVHDYERFFTKQPASAAHIYGKRVVMAEAFTSIGPQWEESPRELKPAFDQAACEGLNLVMLHTFDCSPASMGLPGQAYFAGSHINPNTTWWRHAAAFFGYLDRAQFLLQQGLPVVDVLYFYGENVPSFVRLKSDDPAEILPGHDYDVINSEALVERTSVRDGQIVLPDGMSYRMLVLPSNDSYGLKTLEHIAELVEAGATVVGPRPLAPMGLATEADEARFAELADQLWAEDGGEGVPRVRDISAHEALVAAKIEADFTVGSVLDAAGVIDYFHRRTSVGDIYFVTNRSPEWQNVDASFRVSEKQPELWDAVTGEIRDATAFSQTSGRTNVPLRLPPGGSIFVLYRRDIEPTVRGTAPHNEPQLTISQTLDAPWFIEFDSNLGGPNQPIKLDQLMSWSDQEDSKVKYYSGTAVYRTTFDLKEPAGESGSRRTWLDLGEIKNIASVKLNGSSLGTVWTDPLRVELTGHLRSHGNELEIEVTNLWPNRLIGDARLPEDQRITSTNITKFNAGSPLLPSGLLGPVQLMVELP